MVCRCVRNDSDKGKDIKDEQKQTMNRTWRHTTEKLNNIWYWALNADVKRVIEKKRVDPGEFKKNVTNSVESSRQIQKSDLLINDESET